MVDRAFTLHELYHGVPICPDNAHIVPLEIQMTDQNQGLSSLSVIHSVELINPRGNLESDNYIPDLNANDAHQIRRAVRQAGALDVCQRGNNMFAIFSSRRDISYGKQELAIVPEQEMNGFDRAVDRAMEYLRSENYNTGERLLQSAIQLMEDTISRRFFEEAMSSFGRKDVAAWRWMGKFFYRLSSTLDSTNREIALAFLTRAADLIHDNDIELEATFTLSPNAYLELVAELVTVASELAEFETVTEYLKKATPLGRGDYSFSEPADQSDRHNRELAAIEELQLLYSLAVHDLTTYPRLETLKLFLSGGKPEFSVPQGSKGGSNEPNTSSNTPLSSGGSSSTPAPTHGSRTTSAAPDRDMSANDNQPPLSVGGFAGVEQILQSPGTSSTESAWILYNYETSTTDPGAWDMETTFGYTDSALDMSFQVLTEPFCTNPALVP